MVVLAGCSVILVGVATGFGVAARMAQLRGDEAAAIRRLTGMIGCLAGVLLIAAFVG